MEDESLEKIRLDQFLKLKNITQSGGEAKHVIQNGEVKVNGETETRRGRKLHPGDLIEVFGHRLSVEQTQI
ncbi:MAG: RNA-binding S4 domain-containing protein [Candidatus Obscuribacterales bacterium]|nr:RNA-binding S4 domain-containing protein [Candidatus Obscuribacterales bacterium]